MKLKQLLTLAALASVGLAIQSTARAQSGDLLLGFRVGNATTLNASGYNLEVDLGSISDFHPGVTIDLTAGDIGYNGQYAGGGLSGSDLSTVLGTTSGVAFGFAGYTGNGAGATLYISRSGSPGLALSGGNLSPITSPISGEYGNFGPGDNTSAGAFSSTSFGSTQDGAFDVDFTHTNNYSGAVRPNKGTTDYNFFSEGTTEGALSTSGSVNLELYQYTAGNAPVDEGTFTIGANGSSLTFTGAVPEPSTLTVLAGGVGLLGLLRRRRAVLA